MSEQFFYIRCLSQEKNARELIKNKKLVTLEELACMTTDEIEKIINENYKVFFVGENGEDWMFVEKDKYNEIY